MKPLALHAARRGERTYRNCGYTLEGAAVTDAREAGSTQHASGYSCE